MKRSVRRRSVLAAIGLGLIGSGVTSGESKIRTSGSQIPQVNDDEDVEWNRYYGGDGQTKYTNVEVGPQVGFDVDWETSFGENATALYNEGELLVTNDSNEIYLVNSETGSRDYIHTTPEEPWLGLWFGDLYFFAGLGGTIGRIDLTEGDVDWQRTLAEDANIPLLARGTLYISEFGADILAIDPDSGETLGTVESPMEGDAWSGRLVSDGEGTCFASSWGDESGVFAFDARTQSIEWARSGVPPIPKCDSLGLVTYAVTSEGVEASAINPNTGDVEWKRDYSGVTTEDGLWAALGSRRLFLTTDDQVLAIDREDGRIDWRAGIAATRIVGSGDTVFLASGDVDDPTSIIALNRENGIERWRTDELSMDAVPAFGNGRMYVPFEGRVHALVEEGAGPDFVVAGPTVSESTVTPGASITVSADVKNDGDLTGSTEVRLSLGSEEVTQEITLESGDSETVSEEFQAPDRTGPIEAATAISESDWSIIHVDVEDVELSMLDLSTEVTGDDTETVSTEVANPTDTSRSVNVELIVDGSSVETQPVDLDPSESTTIEFEFEVPDQTDSVDLELIAGETIESTSLTVSEEAESDDTGEGEDSDAEEDDDSEVIIDDTGNESDDSESGSDAGDGVSAGEDDLPGLGVASTLAGIGTASYWLLNRGEKEESDQGLI